MIGRECDSADLCEVRIHGRGGQGNVAAAEMLAQAAFFAGKHVQAFPSFGAERMGAPVAAFVRVATAPIRVRSQIYTPHALIVQDQTLLLGGATNITAGLRSGGLVLLNAIEVPDELIAALPPGARAVAVPATDIAMETVGRGVPNTTLLGAFAALTKLVPLAAVQQVVRKRFPDILGERNALAAARGFAAARARPVRLAPDLPRDSADLDQPSGLIVGLTPGLIAEAGSSAGPLGYHTGTWRTFRPIWNPAACTDCNLCVVYCPESSVSRRGPRDYRTDLAFCKGCALCVEECPSHAISLVREDAAREAEVGVVSATGG